MKPSGFFYVVLFPLYMTAKTEGMSDMGSQAPEVQNAMRSHGQPHDMGRKRHCARPVVPWSAIGIFICRVVEPYERLSD